MAGTNQKAARRQTATRALADAATKLIELLALPVEQPKFQKDQEIADLQRLEYSAEVMCAALAAVQTAEQKKQSGLPGVSKPATSAIEPMPEVKPTKKGAK